MMELLKYQVFKNLFDHEKKYIYGVEWSDSMEIKALHPSQY
jgi:hypothetical protein